VAGAEVRRLRVCSGELGVVQRWERGPRSAALHGLVRRLCAHEHSGGGEARRLEVAQDGVTLILGLGPKLRVSGPGHPARDYDCLLAPIKDSWAQTSAGALAGVQVDLEPLAAHALLRVPMSELSEHLVLDAEPLLGPGLGRLLERLAAADGWERRLDVVEAFLAARLGSAEPPPPDVAWAWSRLRAGGGVVSARALACELGCSRRHLAARFGMHVGLAPKRAARIVRFRSAFAALMADGGGSLAEVAQRAGYYDQPHMDREFRALAGAPPSELLARRLPDGLGIAAALG